MHTQQQGNFAEQLACDFLTSQGLTLCGKNFQRRIGEIDLIMFEPDTATTVLIEVRFRAHPNRGGPLESIDYRKQRKLIKTAKLVQQQLNNPNALIRMDVIGVQTEASNRAANELKMDIENVLYARFRGYEITWITNAITE